MLLTFLIFLITTQVTQAAQTPVAVEVYLRLKGLSGVQVSPQGGAVALEREAALEGQDSPPS